MKTQYGLGRKPETDETTVKF